MPIYEYKCDSCGGEVEKLQRISDAPLRDCPDCGEAGLKRLISAAGFRLKGGGWYETDFKKDGRRNLHDGGKKAGSSGSESADPKPAAEPAKSKSPGAGASSGSA